MPASVHFQKGNYVLNITPKDAISVTRCRFHWIGKLLCLLGMAQRVTVKGKNTYVYLKGNEAFMNRIRKGQGKDLSKLMLGKQKVSYASHRTLRSFHPDLSSKVKHANGCSTYTYSPLEIKLKLGIKEEFSAEEFEKYLESNHPRVDDCGVSPLTEGCTLFIRDQGSIRSIVSFASRDQELSNDDVLFFRSKDRLTGREVMVKLGITEQGIAGVESDYQAAKLLGEHPGLLQIICLTDTPYGTAHISPLYAKGDLFDQRLEPEEIIKGFQQLLDTLVHIHSKQLAYGDFKPENIVRDDNGNWVLVDLETVVARYPTDVQNLRCSPPFVSAEDVEAYAYTEDKKLWQQRCDVAALALLVLDLCKIELGDNPSLGVMQNEVEQAPEELRAVLLEMLNPDPAQRISAKGALQMLTASKN